MKIILIMALMLITPIAQCALEIPEAAYYSVDPKEGPIYITNPAAGLEDLSVYSYTYSVDMDTLKENAGVEGPLFLEIFNPETGSWINTSINSEVDGSDDLTRIGVVNFKVNLADLSGPFLGLSKFRFVDVRGSPLRDANNGDAFEFSGPNIIVNFKDESYRSLGGGRYAYSVMARSERTVAVGLRTTSDGNNWIWVGTPLKSGSKGWTRLEWNNAPHYRVVEFKIYS